MKLTGRLLSTLVLAALSAALVQAEARERGARHGAHPPRSVGQPHPAAARGTNARSSSSPAVHAVNPPPFFVPGPPGNPAKHLTHRPGVLEALKKSAARPASAPRFHRRAPEPASPFAARNAIGLAATSAGMNATAVGRATGPGAVSGSVKANAVGAPVAVPASIPSASVGVAKLGPAAGRVNAVHPALPATSASGGTINGTGMTRPGFAPGALGGPAKIAAGISGTGLKSRAH
jgi:hypothetical protein